MDYHGGENGVWIKFWGDGRDVGMRPLSLYFVVGNPSRRN